MELLIPLGILVAFIVLFVSNARLRSDIDRLRRELGVVSAETQRLAGLFTSAGRSSAPPPPQAAAPPAAAATEPRGASSTTDAAAQPGSPGADVSEAPPAAEPPASPTSNDIRGDLPWGGSRRPDDDVSSAPAAPKRRFEWERFLGVRLPIWIGAVALCVAGFYFVSFAIESGFFGPEFRVLAGVAAALGFLAGAEFVRRRVTTDNASHIASALASAAIATLYATAYIASAVYGLIPESIGFAAMAGVTLLSVAIALAYGQVVALIGLAGGYVTPALFASDAASALFLFGYLGAVHLAFIAVIRARGWWRLTLPALLGPLVWIALWQSVPALKSDPYPAIVYLIFLTLVVGVATVESWLREDEPLWIVGGTRSWERRALPLTVSLSSLGLLAFLASSGWALPYWQGLIAFGVLLVAAGFARPGALGLLQLMPLAAAFLALLGWRGAAPGAIEIMTGICALLFGFGALDQFRRLRRPVLWAAVIAVLTLGLFSILLFKVTGWQAVLGAQHFWAAAALLLGALLLALLVYFGPQVGNARARDRVYAILAAAVATLVSLVVVIEIDPSLFPAAAALAVLGLAGIYTRVPVRGLRVLAGVYTAVWGVLVLGASGEVARRMPDLSVVLAPSLRDDPVVLLLLPGLALLAAATLFHDRRMADAPRDGLAETLNVAGLAALAGGLLYFIAPRFPSVPFVESYVLGARLAGPEALLAGIAVVAGRRLNRRALLYAGLVLAGLVALAMLAGLLTPIYRFWPRIDVPGAPVLNIALLTLGVPALLFAAVGRDLRRDTDRTLVMLGQIMSVFAVVSLYTMMLVLIRQAWHPDMLQGPTGNAEFYVYSAGTLLFGLGLLLAGVVLDNRGARALSLVFVLAATVKVFLFDAAALTGLWRVLSFLGMGLSFLGISWAYARYVFGLGMGGGSKPPASPPPPEPAEGGHPG